MNNKNANILVVIILLVAVGGGSFYGGMKYQQSKTPTFSYGMRGLGQSGQFGQGANGGQGGGTRVGGGMRGTGGAFSPVMGEVLSQDAKSLTVKLLDNSSKIVILTPTTTVNKLDLGTLTDVKVGGKVGVYGTENTDGSITALSIQLNPVMPNFPTTTAPSGK